MANYGDDNDDYEYSGSHKGSGRKSRDPDSYSMRTSFDHTSSFDTAVLSEDGRFLGMKMTPEMLEKARWMYSTGLPIASEWVERFATKHFNSKVGNAAAFGVIFADQIIEFFHNTYSSAQSLNNLRLAVKPLSNTVGAAHTAPLSGTNEVVANARGKINGIFWNNNIQTVAGTVNTFPALYNKITKHQAKQDELKATHEFQSAKGDVDKQAAILEREITVGGNKLGMDTIELHAAKEKMIELRRKSYEAKFKEFEKVNYDAAKKELRDIIKKLNPKDVSYGTKALEREGFEVDRLKDNLKSYYKNGERVERTKKEIEDAVDKFKDAAEKQMKGLIERKLKAKYVRQHGAFDHEWQEYLGNDRNYGATIRSQLEQKVEDLSKHHQKAQEEMKALEAKSAVSDETARQMASAGAGFLAGVISQQLRNMFGGKALEKYAQPIALDRILHLRRTLENGKDHPPEEVPPIAKSKDMDMGYAKYVHTIFQQHQKDSNRTEIGDRFFEHFEKARWNDDAIQKLSDDELTPYELAVKMIAKRVKDGRMDAIALVELVGDRNRKIVRADGRSFGPEGAGKDEAAVKESIHKLIDEKTAILQGGKEQTEEQVNDSLGNFIFSVDDLKKALDSDALEPRQRAFIFTVFSDVVGSDEKLCQKIGVTPARCQELRTNAKESFNELLDGAVNVLADLIEHHPDIIEKQLKLTEKEKKLILSLAERINEEGKDVADTVENREELKSLETVVANATLALDKTDIEDEGKPKSFWQRLVTSSKQPKKAKVKENNQDKDSEYSGLEGESKSFDTKERFDKRDAYVGDESEYQEKKWADEDHVKPAKSSRAKKKNWSSEYSDDSFTDREDLRKSDKGSFDTHLAP